MDCLTLKRHSSFQNLNNTKARQIIFPRRLFFKSEKSMISALVGAPQKLTW